MMLRALQIYFLLLLQTLAVVFAKCILEQSTRERNDETITCLNTSTEDYVYELLELFSTRSEYSPPSGARLGFRIINSNFSATTSLLNPRDSVMKQKLHEDFSILSVNFCGLKSIGKDWFNSFPELVELDLGFNEIDELDFAADLPGTVSILNLTRNRIEYMDFRLLPHPLAKLDLSYNKIVYLHLNAPTGFRVELYLALNNNNISEMRLGPLWDDTYEPELNFAYNNLKLFENFSNNQIRLKSMNLDHSIQNVNVLKDIMSVFSPDKLVLVNNKLQALNRKSSFLLCKRVDFSNCSLSSIPDTIFRNSHFYSLNFSRNDLKLINNNSLLATGKIETLDLSYNKLESVEQVFQSATVTYLNLSHNRISKLGPESFRNLKGIQWLDLSFNNLKLLENYSFVKGNKLSFLNLASNKLANIAEQAFKGLRVSGMLNLENNLLRYLSTNVFKPLTVAGDINLRNNQIEIIQSHLFDSIHVRSIILSENRIESIQSKAFHSLSGLREIHVDDNRCHNMTIGSGAFSELRGVELVSLKNSKIDNINSEIFSNGTLLDVLDIRDNNVTYMNFSSHTNYISINEMRLTLKGDIKPKTFVKPIFLRDLSFWNSDIREIANKAFQGLFHLSSLSLINTTIGHLENDSLNGLFALTHFSDRSFLKGQTTLKSFMFKDFLSLERLNLSSIGLTQIMPSAFSGMKRLETLYLNHNKLNFLHKSAFSGLNRLQLLDLSHNELTYLKRDDFLDLSSLISLNISHNNISDMELGSLQNFPHLQNLSIANNNLTEFKVGAFSNLYELKTLDISQNSISSLLFESFVPLNSLQYLNLEFNNLKTIQHISLVSNLKKLRRIRIAKNKWKCDFLGEILVTFRKYNIVYSSEYLTFFEDNIEGIHCIDVCKYLLCLQDSHGIN